MFHNKNFHCHESCLHRGSIDAEIFSHKNDMHWSSKDVCCFMIDIFIVLCFMMVFSLSSNYLHYHRPMFRFTYFHCHLIACVVQAFQNNDDDCFALYHIITDDNDRTINEFNYRYKLSSNLLWRQIDNISV